MKKLMILVLVGLMTGPVALAAKNKSKAKDCSVAVYKTFLPGFGRCGEINSRAEFAGGYLMLGLFLTNLGYQPVQYDQCENGTENTHAYSLISELGQCGFSGCKLGIGFWGNWETKAKKPLYETILQTSGSNANISLLDAVQDLPACSEL